MSITKKNNQKNDYILIIIAFPLLILSGILIFLFSSLQPWPQTLIPDIIGEASLTINFGDGKERVFEGEIIRNEALINVLVQASKAGNFSYKLDSTNNLVIVENYANNKIKSWQWYLNDKKINGSPGEVILKSGDKILIKYE